MSTADLRTNPRTNLARLGAFGVITCYASTPHRKEIAMLRRAVLLHTAALAMGFAFAGAVNAHEWYSGQNSPTGASCCGGNDCAEVPYSGVACDAAGCDVTVLPGTHPMLPVENVETCSGGMYGSSPYCTMKHGLGKDPVTFRYEGNPGLSPDGSAHACIVASDIAARKVRCLFIGGLY